MKTQVSQLITAVALLIMIAVGVHLLRSKFANKSEPEIQTSMPSVAAPVPPGSVDVGTANLLDSEEDSYVTAATTEDLIPSTRTELEFEDGETLNEEDCLAFMAHVERLDGKKSSRGGSKGAGDGEEDEEAATMCQRGTITTKFARCAMTKTSTLAFVECTDGDVKDALRTAKEALEEAD